MDFEDEVHEPSIAAQGPVTHLLLVVHGVGQKMESASIVRETKKLRRAVQLGSLRISREARGGRVEVLPIQWRKHLTLKTDEHLEGLRANCTPLYSARFISPSHSPHSVRRFLFLVSRHINSTLDSKNGCKGGGSQRQVTFMGVDKLHWQTDTTANNPHECVLAL